MEWLREGEADADVLRATLPILGVAKPAPELLAEILRQSASRNRVEVRVDRDTVLAENRGILAVKNSRKFPGIRPL